jgi:hypothetical protein
MMISQRSVSIRCHSGRAGHGPSRRRLLLFGFVHEAGDCC